MIVLKECSCGFPIHNTSFQNVSRYFRTIVPTPCYFDFFRGVEIGSVPLIVLFAI
jgi:hypothetical protein